jgi:YggT family protein
MMSLLATIVYFALYVFFIALWMRFIFDWVRVLSKNFTPKGPLLILAEASYSVTDKPLTAVRRFVPTIRFGGAAIDLGWSVVMIATLFALSIVDGFRG